MRRICLLQIPISENTQKFYLFSGGRLPALQEVDHVTHPDFRCGFKFSLLLTGDNLAGGIDNRKAGDTFIQWHQKTICQRRVVFSFADIDMHDMVVGSDQRGDLRGIHGLVQNVAVVTLVRAKDYQHALVVAFGRSEGFVELLGGIPRFGV